MPSSRRPRRYARPRLRAWWRRQRVSLKAAYVGGLFVILAAIISPTLSAALSNEPKNGAPETGQPLTVGVSGDHDTCPSYVLNKPPAVVGSPAAGAGYYAWWQRLGAVEANRAVLTITVQGRSSQAAVLQQLRVRVLQKDAPLSGNVFSEMGCGGVQTVRNFSVNLDSQQPALVGQPGARFVPDPTDPSHEIMQQAPSPAFPFRVSENDVEVFAVTANTGFSHVAWVLDLDWTSEGKTGTVTIDDRGRPFETTAASGLPEYIQEDGVHWTPERS